MTKYYIENLGSQTLGDELSRLQTAGADITEHEQMKCLDRQGKPVTHDLYRVPQDVKDRLFRMANSAGFQFAIYRQADGDLPREYYRHAVPVMDGKAKFIGRRRKKLTVLPRGVMSVSVLLSKSVVARS